MTFIGTRGFAPPEQSEKRARRGPFTDVYALAATLYYLLTGELPMNSVIRLQEDTQPAPHELVPGIPEWLSDAAMCGLALGAAQRPHTMAAFCALLTPPISAPTGPSAIPTALDAIPIPHPLLPPDFLSHLEEHFDSISRDLFMVDALSGLATVWTKTNPQKADELLQRALQVAEVIQPDYDTPQALCMIAIAWARTNPQKAEELLQKALQATADIKLNPNRDIARRRVAAAWARIDPQKALHIAQTLETALKDQALCDVASAQARTDPQKARQITQISMSGTYRSLALVEIAAAQARIDPQNADEVLQGSLKVVATLGHDFFEVIALLVIAVAWARTNPLLAEETLQKALKTAEAIKDKDFRAQSLVRVAVTQMQIAPQRAEGNLQKALKATEAIRLNSDMLVALAAAWARVSPPKALEIVPRLQGSYYEAHVRAEVAAAWVRLDADAALQYTLSFSGSVRGRIVTWIARSLANMVEEEEG